MSGNKHTYFSRTNDCGKVLFTVISSTSTGEKWLILFVNFDLPFLPTAIINVERKMTVSKLPVWVIIFISTFICKNGVRVQGTSANQKRDTEGSK